MKAIHYYIYAVMSSLALLSCSGNDDEPTVATTWPDGKTPISLRACEPQQSRADYTSLDGTAYDIYTCTVYYGGEVSNGYYNPTEIRNSSGKLTYYSVFSKMDFNPDDKLFFFYDSFFPMMGTVDLLSYGTQKGKKIEGYAYPDTLQSDQTADHISLDLTGDYDGSFEVIAADRLTVPCTTDLKMEQLPFAHFHHIQAHLRFKFKWAAGVAADAGIVSHLKINGVRIEDTPCQGFFNIQQNVSGGEWVDSVKRPDAVVPNFSPSFINHSNGLEAGKGVYILPQANRKRLIVSYSILNNGRTNTMNYVLADDASLSWEAGHEYTYVITIGGSGDFSINQITVEPFAEGHVGTTVIE